MRQRGAISQVVTVLQAVQVFGKVGVSKSFDSVRSSTTEMGEQLHLWSQV